ncbi:MAG: serine/threonine protein kinase [Bdellovibrionota bacterium]
MAFRPHRFGRYIIVDPIAVGGMAEIYRARLAASKEGPDRIIVIKKVIANLSQNSEFLQMFEEEIKITVGLTHPNIIQIYDYGKNDDQYFMAMEYVEGKNLRQFVKRLADMKSMFSIDMSCYIISQVCHALAYAHAFKDRMSGKALGIVHRDISPQNVMISYDGAVKLFDFGIAKAKSANEATRAGVIKGKPSYLSPEQINGEELDGRCDIFALGIVLWELLTAKRLFVAETDMGVLRLIQSAKIEPPSTFNPAVPQSLDAIVLKGLTRDKNKRYQSAEEFQRDLHKFLYSFNPSFNPADLSYYAQELFKNEIREDRDRLQKYLSIDPIDDKSPDQGPGGDLKNHPQHNGSKNKLSNKLADGLISTTDFNREMMDMVVQAQTGSLNKPSTLELMSATGMPQPKTATVPPPPGQPPQPGQPAKPPVPNAKAPAPDKGSGLIMNTATRAPGGGMPAPRKSGPTDSMVIPPWSKTGGSSAGTQRPGTGTRTSTMVRNRSELSGANDDPSSGSRNMLAVAVVVMLGLVFVARQYGMLCDTPLEFLSSSCHREITAPQDAGNNPPPNGNSTEEPKNPIRSPASAAIMIKTAMQGYTVTVNGRAATVSNGQFNVPLKEALKIEVAKRGFQTQRFVVQPLEKASTYGYDVPAIPVPMGTISYTTLPSANVTFYLGDEKVLDGLTPIKDSLPVGKYRVHIENSLLGIKTDQEFIVEENKLNREEITLEMKK